MYKLIQDKYLSFDILEETGLVKQAFTTRNGGISPIPFNTLNLGFNTGEDPEIIRANHQRIAQALEVDSRRMVRGEQVHGLEIQVVTEQNQGGVWEPDKVLPHTDGLITNQPGIMLASYYADCVPILLLDPRQKAIALLHAGWKGTVGKIAALGVQALQKNFGTRPDDCRAVIAPSVGLCCYQVGEDVASQFRANYADWPEFMQADGLEKFRLDLKKANRQALEEAGVRQIALIDLCTCCRADWFFSYRRQKGKCGRMASLLMLQE